MKSTSNPPLGDAERYWNSLGFNPHIDDETGKLVGIVPVGLVAFCATGKQQVGAQWELLKEIGIPPEITFELEPERRTALYRLDDEQSLDEVLNHFKAAGEIMTGGDKVRLPTSHELVITDLPKSQDELSISLPPPAESD
ncbi:hypothetical protein [Aurantiacibacter luteus]|uniref:hypothetical protein n=1 Tax=Aurantiacibacter luteus TaxID=1581420 RepID=UPI0012E07A63|nr:hypothetical protein [Aurantiacibacter luteus]